MGLISAMARELMAAGLSGDELCLALERLESEANAALERIAEQPGRSKGAERTRRWRENKASQSVTSVTERHSDASTPVHSSQEVTPPSAPKGASSPKRGTRLPDDYAPNIEAAIADGLPRRTAEREALKFLDHFRAAPNAKGGLKLDWDAAWRNWYRRAGDFQAQPRGPPTNGCPVKTSSAQEAFHALEKFKSASRPTPSPAPDSFAGATVETRDFRRVG